MSAIWNLTLANSMEWSSFINGQLGQEDNYMKWETCFRTNSTYGDCPIVEYELKSDYQMNVAIYNPSSNDLSQVRLAVPDDGFKV